MPARYRATRALYTALGFTVLEIALCFVALSITPRIACSHRATVIILTLAVGLGIHLPVALSAPHPGHGGTHSRPLIGRALGLGALASRAVKATRTG